MLGFLTTSPLREPEPRLPDHFSDRLEDDEVQQGLGSAATLTSPLSTPLPQLPSIHPVASSTSEFSVSSNSELSTYGRKPSERPYHTYTDMQWHGKSVRMHSFLTSRETEGVKPVSGMTACAHLCLLSGLFA